MATRINSFSTSCYRFASIWNRSSSGCCHFAAILHAEHLVAHRSNSINKCSPERQLHWLGHQLRTDSNQVLPEYLLYMVNARERNHGSCTTSIQRTSHALTSSESLT